MAKCPNCRRDLNFINEKIGTYNDGTPIWESIGLCPGCGNKYKSSSIEQFANTNIGKKIIDKRDKHSTLSVVSCMFTFVGLFTFPILFCPVGVITGLIDLGKKTPDEKHIGSDFGVILGVIAIACWYNNIRLFS